MNQPKHWIWQNGVLVDQVSPANRGLAYGDGLFETMRVSAGDIPWLSRHIARLAADLLRLAIPFPGPDIADFLRSCCYGVDQGVLKLIVARGEGGRGYLPDDRAVPVCIVSLFPMPTYEADYSAEGIGIGISSLRLGQNSLLAGMKHLNRLEQVMIRRELAQQGLVEGIVLDAGGLVIEAAFSNICIVSGGVMATPLLDTAGVAGVMRAWVMEHAHLAGLEERVSRLSLSDLLDADELFLCNSVNGIWPVTRLAERHWRIGSRTRALQQLLARHW